MPAVLSVTAKTIGDIGVLAGGDELLDAVEHVAVAAALGARRDRARVGADLRLGQAEAAEPFAARQRPQILFLLRVGAERVDRPADDGVLHADDRRRRAVAGGDLLERDGERHVVHAGAAPALRARPCRARRARPARAALRAGSGARDPSARHSARAAPRESAHRVADQLLFSVSSMRVAIRARRRSSPHERELRRERRTRRPAASAVPASQSWTRGSHRRRSRRPARTAYRRRTAIASCVAASNRLCTNTLPFAGSTNWERTPS